MRTRRLLKESITHSAANDREGNVLHQLSYHDQQTSFFSHLEAHTDWMSRTTAHHLQLRSPDACRVAKREDWIHGSFNVCIPITIDPWLDHIQQGNRVMLRFPLPYRVGDAFHTGNGDEKIRCEAGAYAWLQQNCPNIPIPHLYGFSVSTGETFTRLENLLILYRCFQSLRRHVLSWIGLQQPSVYVPRRSKSPGIDVGYLLIEHIEQSRGDMLSKTWLQKNSDAKLRTNFFRSLSQILLDMSRIPLPRIGSFVIDNKGYLCLSNRPLTMELQMLENEGIPSDIPRNYTYTRVESYNADILHVHDNRLRHQPNAVNDITDCSIQMATLAAMRVITPTVFSRQFHRGPFVFSLTDLHQSNIFVDDDWNITCLVDLEWACSRPIEMVELPYWLTGKGVDQIDAEEYNIPRSELMSVLESEENLLLDSHSGCHPADKAMPRLSEVLAQGWRAGTFWTTLALSSPPGLFTIFGRHIYPLFRSDGSPADGSLPFLWTKDGPRFVNCKVSDKKEYDDRLRLAFDDI